MTNPDLTLHTPRPGRWNFICQRGEDFYQEWEYGVDVDGPTYVLAVPQMEIRRLPNNDSPLIIRLDTIQGGIAPIENITGRWSMSISAANTFSMGKGRYYYDLFARDSAGRIIAIMEGTFTIEVSTTVVDF